MARQVLSFRSAQSYGIGTTRDCVSRIRLQVFRSNFQILVTLNQELAQLSIDERSKLPGLSRARAEIIVAGGQLLEALMEKLEIDHLTTCEWALREGVILAYQARQASAEAGTITRLERDPSLRGALALLDHYQGDRKHSVRVATLAQQLFGALRPIHLLGSEHQRLLAAAALLHDIGYFVAHTNHNKHSAYLIENSELTGFMTSEVAIIANVARYHRSSLPKAKHPYFSVLPAPEQDTVRKLASILRVADALDRDHEGRIKSVGCKYDDDTIYLTAHCSRASDATRYRIEERVHIFAGSLWQEGRTRIRVSYLVPTLFSFHCSFNDE